jgi:hypothetical protein
MARKFSYDPLNPALNEIRLLTIDSNGRDSRVQLRLVHTSLDDSPNYVALSYTWDSPFGTQDTAHNALEVVLLNGHTIQTQENLANALRTFPMSDSTFYWIDAICIDQSNITERNEQVLRMQDIYMNAKKVLAWLGPEKDDSNLALDFAEAIATRARSSWREARQWIRTTTEDESSSHLWQALMRLMSRSWWRRVWVIQETAVAKDVQFLCGERQIAWPNLAWTLYSLVEDIAYLIPVIEKITDSSDLGISISAANGIRLLREQWQQRGSLPLLYVLDRSRTTLASDARDKIFAIIGLLDPETKELLEPNYNLLTDDVYKALVKTYVEGTGDLQIITLAHDSPERTLPSWAPDWSRNSVRSPLSFAVMDGVETSFEYSASLEVRSAIQFSEDMEVMSCRGMHIDTVDALGFNPWAYSMGDDPYVQSTTTETVYTSKKHVFEAIWRSCCGDFVWDGGLEKVIKAPEIWGNIFSRMCKSIDEIITPFDVTGKSESGIPTYRDEASVFERRYQDIRWLQIGGRTIRDWVLDQEVASGTENVSQEELTWADLERDIIHLMPGRRMVKTEKGYLGPSHDNTRIGDRVHILLGCKTPVILRPIGDHFQFIGECYIHGIMRGEAMEDLKQGKYALETFSLR